MHHTRWLPALAACWALGAQAGEADDLAAIRAQIDDMKRLYEGRIAALENKLAKAEAARTAPPVAAAAAAPAGASSPASGFNPEVSLILQGQYKQQKKIAERGITGFWPAAAHSHDGGVAEADKRGFSLNHTELMLAANIDPFWRGQAVIAMLDGQAEVEEAWVQRLGMGGGLGLKAGRFRSSIGYLNEQHPHQWDFADAPLMYQAMFGPEGYVQDGAQLKWLAPTPVYLELGAEFGRGANFPGTDRNKNGSGSGALTAHVGDDVGLSHSWRGGVSYLRTAARDRAGHLADRNGEEVLGKFSGQSATWIADLVWKWTPPASSQSFKLQAEYFNRRETGDLSCADAGSVATTCTGGVTLGDYRTRQSGWYAQGVYQFSPLWRAGYRHERLNSGTPLVAATAANTINPASAVLTPYRPQRQSLMLDYSWSEFSRVRLQLARDRSMQGVSDQQVTVQYIMSLGAHGAHKY